MNLKQLKTVLEDKSKEYIAHNSQHEHAWLLKRGINANIKYDTMFEARLLDSSIPSDLGSLSLRYEVDKAYKDLDPSKLQGKALEERPTRDARNTLDLHNILYPQLSDAEKQVYHEVLVPAAKTMAQIEIEGVCVDPKRIEQLEKDIDKRLAKLNLQGDPAIKKFNQVRGVTKKGVFIPAVFNPNSTDQKVAILYDMLGYTPIAYTDNELDPSPKADAETLEALLRLEHTTAGHRGGLEECGICPDSTISKINIASKLKGWKEKFLGQMKNTMVKVGPKYFVYSSLMGYGAVTGRVISSNPNLQNTPNSMLLFKEKNPIIMRSIFISRYGTEGALMEFDYKGIEFRIWVCLAQLGRLIELILKGGDIHTDTARIIFSDKRITKEDKEKRFMGKTFNYAIINGGGPDRLSLLTGQPVEVVSQWFKRFWREYPEGKVFWENWVDAETRDDWGHPRSGIVYSPTGMKRRFTVPTEARNHLIQNPALVIISKAANLAVPYVKRSGLGVVDLMVHDSLRLDCKNEKARKKLEPQVKEIMEAQTISWLDDKDVHHNLSLPFTVDVKVGKTWGDMKELE